jgi:hypothetical protein
MAKLFYFCHLKKLVRPETFGPYYVRVEQVEVTVMHLEKQNGLSDTEDLYFSNQCHLMFLSTVPAAEE